MCDTRKGSPRKPRGNTQPSVKQELSDPYSDKKTSPGKKTVKTPNSDHESGLDKRPNSTNKANFYKESNSVTEEPNSDREPSPDKELNHDIELSPGTDNCLNQEPGNSKESKEFKRDGRSQKRKSDEKRPPKRPRLKNVDRSTAQTREVTVNNVTVTITEYKAKKKISDDSSSSSSDEGQTDTNSDARSNDLATESRSS